MGRWQLVATLATWQGCRKIEKMPDIRMDSAISPEHTRTAEFSSADGALSLQACNSSHTLSLRHSRFSCHLRCCSACDWAVHPLRLSRRRQPKLCSLSLCGLRHSDATQPCCGVRSRSAAVVCARRRSSPLVRCCPPLSLVLPSAHSPPPPPPPARPSSTTTKPSNPSTERHHRQSHH